MSIVSRYALVPIEEAWAAVVDPTTYPEWLVGARKIRDIDDGWPAVGSRFHHRVGLAGPLSVADTTEVLAIEEPHRLTLEARARPFGRAKVDFRLATETGDDGRTRTRITVDEVALGAVATVQPVLDPVIDARNRASLNALVAYLNAPR
ncbi:MAG: Polyketide cyclase/dehydrase [Acidimicrobiales bacterium]|nr:Polyketide cyclase/dehydrase [Acidimicrobiales bacterium]